MVTLSPQQFREIIQRVPALVVSANGHVEQPKMGTSQHGKYADVSTCQIRGAWLVLRNLEI
jgi:hypothetical protein